MILTLRTTRTKPPGEKNAAGGVKTSFNYTACHADGIRLPFTRTKRQPKRCSIYRRLEEDLSGVIISNPTATLLVQIDIVDTQFLLPSASVIKILRRRPRERGTGKSMKTILYLVELRRNLEQVSVRGRNAPQPVYERDQVVPVLALLESTESHFGAWNVFLRVLKVLELRRIRTACATLENLVIYQSVL